MKKIAFVLMLSVLVLGTASGLFAVKKTLINFDQYEKKLEEQKVYPKSKAKDENGDGKIDYNERKKALEIDQTTGLPKYEINVADMLIEKWIVLLNSSANTVSAKQYSMCKKVQTKGKYTKNKRWVLGARIHFPKGPFNAWAKIRPPFEFRAFGPKGDIVGIENGVVDNTGQIYQIVVEVNGRNYNHSLTIRLKDDQEDVTDYFMGYLYFAGWKKLIWKNPNYIENVDIREIFRLPLYPKSKPYKKLDCFIVYRHGNVQGGDFVTYIANVTISFDKAVLEEEMDINDEEVWQIITQRQKAKAAVEEKRNAELIELRRVEMLRKHNSEAERKRQAGAGGGAAKPANQPGGNQPGGNQPGGGGQ